MDKEYRMMNQEFGRVLCGFFFSCLTDMTFKIKSEVEKKKLLKVHGFGCEEMLRDQTPVIFFKKYLTAC